MLLFAMAGASSRFAEAGYEKPKFMLPVGDGYCFDYAVAGLARAMPDEALVLVMRADAEQHAFVTERCAALALKPQIVTLEHMTRGQAETVLLGLRNSGASPSDELTIFNIDTFRVNFTRPDRSQRGDGYLEVFEGDGENWSFARTDSLGRVVETREKGRISNLCSTGLYHFRQSADFVQACEAALAKKDGPECYVAPLYNQVIAKGRNIRAHVIPRAEVVFSGIPLEYETLLGDPQTIALLKKGIDNGRPPRG